jgi:hypothetical protein
MRQFILTYLTPEDQLIVDKNMNIEDPGKLGCKTLQRIWAKMEDKKMLDNCFCSGSTRKSFKKMFYEMYAEFRNQGNEQTGN